MCTKYFCFILCNLLIYAGLSESSRENTISDARDDGNDLKGYEGGERTKRGIGSKVFGLGSISLTVREEQGIHWSTLYAMLLSNCAAMIIGLRARQKLLGDLKPVKKVLSTTFYNKNGGVTEMIRDFDSVNPTNVLPVKLNGMVAGRIGNVGDRVISYDTGAGTGPRSLMLSKTKRNGEMIVDIVTYR